MPAKRPRISVVLDVSTMETLRRVAAVEGRSVSAVVGELVETFEPGLRQVAELGERFEAASASQREAIRRAMADAEPAVVEPLQAAVAALEAFYSAGGGVEHGAEVIERRPPLGNTGVR